MRIFGSAHTHTHTHTRTHTHTHIHTLTQSKDFLALLQGSEPPMSCKILSHTTITVSQSSGQDDVTTKTFVKVTALDHEKTLICIQDDPGKVVRPLAAVACRWPLLDTPVLGRGKNQRETSEKE
jgi:hypothetical protein